MTSPELKNNLHQLIDSIENDSLLTKFYLIILKMRNVDDGDLWKLNQ